MPLAGNQMRRAPPHPNDSNPFGAKPVKARATPGTGLGGGSKSRLTGTGIGIGIVLAIALGVWMFWPNGGGPGSGHPVAATSNAATSGPAGELIGKADQAFAAGRYVATRWQQRCRAVPRCVEDRQQERCRPQRLRSQH